ncbi:hypothetical protein QVD17_37861 [Tagetes erecta]|uniref:EGF-like domain-containing protein n=1 Tax=Tagetes erecta TaxID=13708 RepID=A0AAD8JX63_TARER|nr:hypothetical protein QVD17_37861 [Tagetes erecta]
MFTMVVDSATTNNIAIPVLYPFGVATNNIAKPGCPTQCGNVTVPYPFGIGIDCSIDPSFNLTCNTSSNEPPKLFMGTGYIQIYNISNSEVRIATKVSYNCFNQPGSIRRFALINLRRYKAFTFSAKNKFTVIGCDDYALIMVRDDAYFSGGCFGLCGKGYDVPNGECFGIGCCQTSIPKGLSYYNATLGTINNHLDVWSFNKCGYGFLVEEGSFEFGGAIDLSTERSDFVNRIESTMHVVLDWVIAPNESCGGEVNLCKRNSLCYDVEGGGYRCKCHIGYEGNPYLDPGCQEGRVMSTFDALVVKEGSRDEFLALANIAMRCLNLSGKYRPTMKEVAVELESIRISHVPFVVQTNTRSIM